MKIYIAGPYAKGDTAINVRNAILAAEQVIAKGHIPYIPHLTHFWHLLAPHEHRFWLDYDLNWVAACDAILRLPGESVGADGELDYAWRHGKTIYRSIDEIP